MNLSILTIITFLPLVAALVIVFVVPKRQEKVIYHLATWSSLATFLVSLVPVVHYDKSNGGFQFLEVVSWIPS